MSEEFLKFGLHLEDQVDLIVTKKTLQHLVDPIGTIDQAYSLLAKDALLIGTGYKPNGLTENEPPAATLRRELSVFGM